MAQKKWSVEGKLEITLTALRGDLAVVELCRKHGVCDATYYKWRSQFLEGGKQALTNGKKRSSNRERQLLRELQAALAVEGLLKGASETLRAQSVPNEQ